MYRFLFRFVTKVLDLMLEILKTRYYSSLATFPPKTRFLAGSSILNPKKNRNLISIGDYSIIRCEIFVFPHSGEVKIGSWCYVGEGTKIWSSKSIEIGNRVLISHGVNIHDTNGHPVSSSLRHQHFVDICKKGHPVDAEYIQAAEIRISDDAWIGFGSTILKGVTIGKGAVVGAGSVVTNDIPPWTIVGGNPAKIIREIPEDER
jgi:acetyltransferase-like isoleucine patch superfamily enzyme